jgi:hypothetical protein
VTTVLGQDRILLPYKRMLCETCREATHHAYVGGAWICNVCGRKHDAGDRAPLPQLICCPGCVKEIRVWLDSDRPRIISVEAA